MKITKFPYFFYFNSNIDVPIINGSIKIKDKDYSLTQKNKYLYLLLRYVPIFLLFSMVFNSYDFSFDNTKILQYIATIIFFLLVVVFKRTGLLVSVISLLIIGILSIFDFINVADMSMQYISKYFIFIYTIYDLIKNFQITLYEVKEDEKIKAHLILKGDN
jgi:hypothetical protein